MANDSKADALSVIPVDSIEHAIAQMRQIEQSLTPPDGLRDFNRMYLGVTEAVRDRIGADFFANPEFMGRLDIVFANRYFAAVAANLDRTRPPRAWNVLLTHRHDHDVEAIQFALVGMNAHINFDLAVAVVTTCEELGLVPHDGTLHADYQKVDAILDGAEAQVRESFEHGIVRRIDRLLSPVENIVANWSMNSARTAAWVRARALWHLRSEKELFDDYIAALDHFVAFAGRSLLIPSPLPTLESFLHRVGHHAPHR